MNLTKRVGFLTGAAAITLAGVSMAAAAEADKTDREYLAALEARIAELEGQQSGNWLNERRAIEMRSVVQDVLADADTRANLLQGAGAGYSNGFYIGDANNRLNIGGLVQARYIYSDNKGAASEELRGFDNPNTRLDLSGHLNGGDWKYRVQGGFMNGSGGSFNLLDAYLTWDYDNAWSMTIGQFKAPLMRETLVDVRYQLAASRSLIESTFGGGRTQGIMATYDADNMRFHGSFNDGAGAANSTWTMTPADYAFTGRFEFLSQGTWGQFSDFTSWDGEEMGMLFGGAAHYQRANATGDKTLVLTADAQMEFGAANAFGALVWSNVDYAAGGSDDMIGILLQGGMFFVPDEWEVFGRIEWADDDSALENLTVFTAGVNRYFAKHNAKWTTDLGWNLNRDVSATFINDTAGNGWRANGGSDRQIVLRSQFQLLF